MEFSKRFWVKFICGFIFGTLFGHLGFVCFVPQTFDHVAAPGTHSIVDDDQDPLAIPSIPKTIIKTIENAKLDTTPNHDDQDKKTCLLTTDKYGNIGCILQNFEWSTGTVISTFDPLKYKTIALTVITKSYLPLFDIWYNWYQHTSINSSIVLFIVYITREHTLKTATNDTLTTKIHVTPNINCTNCIIVSNEQFIYFYPRYDQINKQLKSNWNLASILWIFRVNLVNYLLHNLPFNILLTDVDALWLDNPIAYINRLQSKNNRFTLDIVASRGEYPPDMSVITRYFAINTIALGININISQNINNNETRIRTLNTKIVVPNYYDDETLIQQLIPKDYNKICMGFVYFKNSYSIRLLFTTIKNNILTNVDWGLDDQTAINKMIGDFGIYGTNHVMFGIDMDDDNIHDDDDSLRYESIVGNFWRKNLLIQKYNVSNITQTIGVGLLPNDKFVRYCGSWYKGKNLTVVAHCLSQRTVKLKDKWMRHLDLISPT